MQSFASSVFFESFWRFCFGFKELTFVCSTEEVLGCDWLSRLGKFDCSPSLFQAELIDIHSDRVLASLPKHRLQTGAYRCQLVPYDRDQPFIDCTSTEQSEAKP
ncbi:hypothetical protein ACOMHN_009765 [Nucella lapillus]